MEYKTKKILVRTLHSCTGNLSLQFRNASFDKLAFDRRERFGRIITVVRDRDSNSERLLYFGRVSFFYFFFRPPNFRSPWADFRETLPHDAVCAEIVYVL